MTHTTEKKDFLTVQGDFCKIIGVVRRTVCFFERVDRKYKLSPDFPSKSLQKFEILIV